MRARIAFAGSILSLLSACGGGGGETTVSMPSGQRFEPERLTIQAGDTVTWTNDAGDAHTVTAYEEAIPDGAPFFSSGDVDSEQAARENMGRTLIGPGESYEFTFEEPGTYRYFCIPHEEAGMRGTIVVE